MQGVCCLGAGRNQLIIEQNTFFGSSAQEVHISSHQVMQEVRRQTVLAREKELFRSVSWWIFCQLSGRGLDDPERGPIDAQHTVDGSEILREHQLRLIAYPILFKGFSTIQTVGFIAGFLHHQQYVEWKVIWTKPSKPKVLRMLLGLGPALLQTWFALR